MRMHPKACLRLFQNWKSLQDLGRARVVTSPLVNGVPQTHIELAEGVRKHVLGEALSTVEQQWLAAQMNDHIEVPALCFFKFEVLMLFVLLLQPCQVGKYSKPRAQGGPAIPLQLYGTKTKDSIP